MYGTARLSDIGDSLRIPFEVLEPTFARPASRGGRTVAISKPPWNGSRIVFWLNAIGTTNRRHRR
jgi:hypothetical protein